MATEDESAIKFAILTVSDSCFEKKAQDLSGNALETLITQHNGLNGKVVLRDLVPDDINIIKEKLIEICETKRPDVILTTGGTGFSGRDVTPEATRAVLDRDAPGLSFAMLQGSLKITPMAMLSRPVCGIRKQTVIVNLPGSTKASTECFSMLVAALPHAVHLLRGNQHNVKVAHQKIQGSHHQHHHQCHHSLDYEASASSEQQPLARRARKSTFPAISVAEAVEIVLREASVLGTENVTYLDCGGRVLAEDIYAKDPLPPFPASIKDGYAVIAEDGPGVREVLGGSHAGSGLDEFQVQPGQCVRINTGAPLPPGANAVVQVEDTKLVKDTDSGNVELEIEILVAPKPGQDIRQVGSDIAKGQKVLEARSIVGYSEQGMLAMVGAAKVLVYRLPIVGLLSTGNELVDPGVSELEPGKIRDSNKTLLTSLVQHYGFPIIDLGIATDNVDSLVKVFENSLKKCDVIISTGGVSMGDKDLLKPVLKQHFGANIHFGRVLMKPGLPTTFMTVESNETKKLIFALPGNPVSAAVTSNLFVVPALRKMAGFIRPQRSVIKAKIGHAINLDPRPEFQRAVLEWPNTGDYIPLAHVTGNQISSRLLNMITAQGLIILPAGTKVKNRLEEGDVVDCMLIGNI